MESQQPQESEHVVLDAPNPVEVRPEKREKPSLIWSSGSEASSALFGAVRVDSVDRSMAESPSHDLVDGPPSSYVQHEVHEYVSSALDTLERRLETVLDSISDELTSEVIRERQHLVLMQEKVDMQGQALQREFTELNKKMTQESTIRTMVQQKYREQNDALGENLQTMSKEIADLKAVISKIETPWMYRAFNNVLSVFQQCSGGTCEYEPLRGNSEDP